MLLDLGGMPLTANIAIFTIAAATIWFVGTRLARIADTIQDRTGLGQAFVGLILLAGATSLPELATTITASVSDSSALAVGNLLGGVVTQTAVLAVADLMVINRSLVYLAARPVLILQGLLLVIMLAIVIVGTTLDVSLIIGHVGIWTLLLMAVFLVSLYVIHRYRDEEHWRRATPPRLQHDEQQEDREREQQEAYRDWSIRRLVAFFALGGGVVLIAGAGLAISGDAIAFQTGISETFIGAMFLSLATSLPEVSTTIGAVRVGAYTMAVSNVFGSNLSDTSLLFVADIAYLDGLVLQAAGQAIPFAATMGIIVTTFYLIALVVREHRPVLGQSVASIATVIAYIGTMATLYLIR